MDDRTYEELQAHASRAEVNPSRLVNRYVKEGLRMDAHPAITFRTTSLGRRATVLAARPGLQVIDVISTWRAEKQDIAATARYLGLSEDDVRAVLSYYADYKEEVDRDLKTHVDAQENYKRVLETRQARSRRRAAKA
jgi:uncharacterized protein (DUF433 family)